MASERIAYPGVSVVIPTWNGLRLLKQSLDQVVNAQKAYAGECEIIIVDNGSSDRTVDVLYDYYPEIVVERLEKNMGFGYACNLGVKRAKNELILFLNNDVYVPHAIIGELVDAFMGIDNVFSVCPETRLWRENMLTDTVFSSAITFSYDENGELIQHWLVDDGKNLVKGVTPTAYVTGAIQLVDKKKFLELGGFDALYGLAYWEDVDVCLKAWNHGWGSYCANDSHAWHQVSATSGNDEISAFKKRQMTLNYILLQLVHLRDPKLLLHFVFQFFSFLLYLVKTKKEKEALLFVDAIVTRKKDILEKRELNKSAKLFAFADKKIYSAPRKGWKSKSVLADYMENKW